MIDALALRNAISSRVARAHQLKLQGERPDNICEHELKRYKETIKTDNNKFRGRAHFIVLACSKCKDKRRIDYVVEL